MKIDWHPSTNPRGCDCEGSTVGAYRCRACDAMCCPATPAGPDFCDDCYVALYLPHDGGLDALAVCMFGSGAFGIRWHHPLLWRDWRPLWRT